MEEAVEEVVAAALVAELEPALERVEAELAEPVVLAREARPALAEQDRVVLLALAVLVRHLDRAVVGVTRRKTCVALDRRLHRARDPFPRIDNLQALAPCWASRQGSPLNGGRMRKENDLEGKQDMGGKHGGRAGMPKPEPQRDPARHRER